MGFFAKLFGIKEVTVDAKLSPTSDHPVASKAIHRELKAVESIASAKQDKTSFKTVNGESIVGTGNIEIKQVQAQPASQPAVIDSAVTKDGRNAVAGGAIHAAIAAVFQDITAAMEGLRKTFTDALGTKQGKEDAEAFQKSVTDAIGKKQDQLTLKTINGESIIGKGDITIKGETVVNEVQVPVASAPAADTGNACYLPKADVLTQSMLNVIPPRKTIIIVYDYKLTGVIQFPDYSHIVFMGGSLNGAYKVTGNHCTINEDVAYSIFNDAIPVGFDFSYVDVHWFGAVADYNESTKKGTDNKPYFERAINLLGEYYNGLYIKLVGKYYIGSTITTEHDVNICGSHFPSRWATTNSSPSVIAVGAGVTAFKMMGHNPGGKGWTIAYLFIKNIKVVGHSTSNSTFIEYKALGCPTRISSIEECEFTGLRYGLFVNIERGGQYTTDTSLGNLSILKCLAYECTQFVRGYSSTVLSNSWVGNVFNNIAIRDCNIEHNSAKYSIELGSRESDGIHGAVFGNAVIDNNNLEGQPTPIRIICGYGNVTISNNYFEATSGDYVYDVQCTNSKSVAVLIANYYSVHNRKVRVSNFGSVHALDYATVTK